VPGRASPHGLDKPDQRARWVTPTSDGRYPGVRSVEISVRRGRIEIGSRARSDVRLRTTVAVSGWRARWARLRPPPLDSPDVRDGVLHLACRTGLARVQLDVPADIVVRASVEQGDLTMWGVGGDLDLAVGDGILAGRDLSAGSVRASNRTGEVNLHFGAVPTTVEARSGDGPVLLVLPSAVYRVAADAGADITVPVDATATPTIVARSVGGAVSVLEAEGSQPI
jgi:hypothetical protein